MAAVTTAVFAGISALTSIAGGISGAGSAAQQNRKAQQNYEKQQQAAENTALITNAYNKLAFEAEKINYQRQRQYQFDTAMRQWQYDTEIQDYQYLQTARQFLSSAENTQQQLTYNTIAAREAIAQEQISLNEIKNQVAFQQEGLLIERLQNEGKAAMLQAGGSRSKAIQTTVGDMQRNAAILSASLASAGMQSQRNLRDIAMSKYADDLKARNAMMIEPERLPGIPKPLMPPERVFVEPIAATADFIPAPFRQSTFAPLAQGIAAGTAQVAMAAKPTGS